jgi:hypothetical protein
MKKLGFAAALAGGVTAGLIGLAGTAAAAPSGPVSAQDTINELQSDGYTVVVNRVGTTPLSEATVVSVRPGQTFYRTDSSVPGGRDTVKTTVTGKTVYVDVK